MDLIYFEWFNMLENMNILCKWYNVLQKCHACGEIWTHILSFWICYSYVTHILKGDDGICALFILRSFMEKYENIDAPCAPTLIVVHCWNLIS